MGRPTRSRKTTKGEGSVPKGSPIDTKADDVKNVEDAEAAVSETKVTQPEDTADKDALIKELQAQLLSQEDQAAKIKDLQKQLAAAEKNAPSAGVGTEDFKLRPDEDDPEDFYYFEVTWHPKRSPAEEEFVSLGVNGKMMMWARNIPAVIRSDYLEVADNAFSPKFTQLPGEDRKQVGGLKPFTYTINRKITEDEYLKRKKEGDAALRNHLQQQGIA